MNAETYPTPPETAMPTIADTVRPHKALHNTQLE